MQRLLKKNSEPHTGARPSVRLCVGPELARCVHICSVSLYICRVVLILLKYRRSAAGSGLGTTAKYLRRQISGAAGNGLGTTAKYVRGAVGIGLGTTIKYFRRTTNAAAGKGLGTLHKQALMPVCQSLATF